MYIKNRYIVYILPPTSQTCGYKIKQMKPEMPARCSFSHHFLYFTDFSENYTLWEKRANTRTRGDETFHRVWVLRVGASVLVHVFSFSLFLGSFYICSTAVYKMIIRELCDYQLILMTVFSKSRLPLPHSLEGERGKKAPKWAFRTDFTRRPGEHRLLYLTEDLTAPPSSRRGNSGTSRIIPTRKTNIWKGNQDQAKGAIRKLWVCKCRKCVN